LTALKQEWAEMGRPASKISARLVDGRVPTQHDQNVCWVGV